MNNIDAFVGEVFVWGASWIAGTGERLFNVNPGKSCEKKRLKDNSKEIEEKKVEWEQKRKR